MAEKDVEFLFTHAEYVLAEEYPLIPRFGRSTQFELPLN
jgi:hypothetical protein